MDPLKLKVRKGLETLFAIYKDKGITSIYLYGSITGPDFDPENSDIDSIAIARTSTPMSLEKEMIDFLSETCPDIPHFGTRILYYEELQTAQSRGSSLTTYLPPEALLLDLPYWEYIVGEKLNPNDLAPVSYQEGLEAMKGVLRKWHWEDNSLVTPDKAGNYLKVIARAIWMIDGLKQNTYPFSYSVLAKRTDEYASLANSILEIKKNNWSYEAFFAQKDLFQVFVLNILSSQ
jgi:predicted nucleotidyltransferase